MRLVYFFRSHFFSYNQTWQTPLYDEETDMAVVSAETITLNHHHLPPTRDTTAHNPPLVLATTKNPQLDVTSLSAVVL